MTYRKKLIYCLSFLVLICSTGCENSKSSNSQYGYKLIPVPFHEVEWKDQFWKPRLTTQAQTLVPFALDKTRPAVENLAKTAKFLKGDTTDLPFAHRFIASDLYKVMEGAALLLAENPNPALEAQLDSIIAIIGEAQQPDGYLYEAHITGVSRHHEQWGGSGMGDKPYSFVLHSHELYNMGHMYEGAIAYYQATGKDNWLKIAEKNAQHINQVFFVGDPNYNGGNPVNQAPGHEEIELALAKLYAVTGNTLYLEMAKKFLDIRGVTYHPDGEGVMSATYAHQHLPVTQQTTAVGHAVRATYLYSGMADVGALTGSAEYNQALDAIWHNLVDTKMHITGGLGAIHGIEGFGPEYVLPNKEAYNETCAAVGNVLFNYRMFLLNQDARYMDVAEVSLYNNVLAGVNLEGNAFFYVNPLESDGKYPFNHGRAGRSPWFGTACCPSNIARLIPQVSGMMYAHTDDEIYVSLYGSSETTVLLNDGKVKLDQRSDYPFDGRVELKIFPQEIEEFTVKMRIPTWVSDQFVPGALYSFVNPKSESWSLKINDEQISVTVEKGFASIRREWKSGDRITLDLPMPIRYNKALDEVKADRDRLAISRGPLVYCLEASDNDGDVQRFFIDDLPNSGQTKALKETIGVLTGITSIQVPASAKTAAGITPEVMNLIPYYAWNNRGDQAMNIWIPTNSDLVVYETENGIKGGKFDYVKASSVAVIGDLQVLQLAQQPASSDDRTLTAWASEQSETSSIVEIGLRNQPIRSVNIYWYERGNEVHLPESWRMEYLKNGKWEPFGLYVTDAYNTFLNQYNVVHPDKELTCDAIKIIMTSSKDHGVGILDLDITYENVTE